MRRLKITAHVSKVIINHEMYFDWLLYHAQIKRLNPDYWNFAQRPLDIEKNGKLPLPLKKHTTEQIYSYDNDGNKVLHNQTNSNVYLCSKAYYEVKHQHTEQIRKRFEDLSFEKRGEEKRVYLSMGKHKNYDIPRQVTLTDKIHWIVVGDPEWIMEILDDVHNIGKEYNIGYGRIDRWEIEETQEEWQRMFPTIHVAPHEILQKTGCFPPYPDRRKHLQCAFRYF